MKTILLGGPGHLTGVDADAGVQFHDWSDAHQVHRYSRKLGLDGSGTSVRAFFVHQDLSDGEAQALIMMYQQAV